ncbi:MAG: ribosomal protein S18-alanine N-acetyltransferase [Scytonema sp. PMC 1069.18]|nr:ribosomal protein S18-alanine N-acetyltransferase [Scytonema sp. PMC 1069.18]MEC4883500.1 ribosomal protein S18-alanine N-acetyltransferase [Scytonema sp. PMC 1070.18]
MSKITLEIKLLTPADLSAVLELDRTCFGGLWSLEAYQRELDSPNSDLLGLFSSVSMQLLGMGCFWTILDEAHITILAVHPQYHYQGFGQALLYYLLKTACDRRLERATLEVRVSNSVAISLYQKFGFKTAGTRRRYYADNGEDALILWLGGLQHPKFQQNLDEWKSIICDRLSQSSYSLRV